MYCTACGTTIPEDQPVCPQCGQPRADFAPPAPSPQPPIPRGPVPPQLIAWELERYRSQVKALAYGWIIYGALWLLLGFAGLSFARMFFTEGFGYDLHGRAIPPGVIPFAAHLVILAVCVRAALAFVAGWALLQFSRWGRIFAIVIAFLSLIRIPLGTAMGIWTLVMLLGARHTSLYELL